MLRNHVTISRALEQMRKVPTQAVPKLEIDPALLSTGRYSRLIKRDVLQHLHHNLLVFQFTFTQILTDLAELSELNAEGQPCMLHFFALVNSLSRVRFFFVLLYALSFRLDFNWNLQPGGNSSLLPPWRTQDCRISWKEGQGKRKGQEKEAKKDLVFTVGSCQRKIGWEHDHETVCGANLLLAAC